jgi:hypothetical protein
MMLPRREEVFSMRSVPEVINWVDFSSVDPCKATGVNLALFADDTCLCATECKHGCVLRKLQRCTDSMAACCKCWNIKIKDEETQAIYFSHQIRPPEITLTMNGRNIPFVIIVKYLGVICNKKITWRLNIETVTTKACRTFIRQYSLFRSQRLCTHFKLTLHKALIRSVMTYTCPAWEFTAETHLLKLQWL